MTLADDILSLVTRKPGLTEVEIAKDLFGRLGYQRLHQPTRGTAELGGTGVTFIGRFMLVQVFVQSRFILAPAFIQGPFAPTLALIQGRFIQVLAFIRDHFNNA